MVITMSVKTPVHSGRIRPGSGTAGKLPGQTGTGAFPRSTQDPGLSVLLRSQDCQPVAPFTRIHLFKRVSMPACPHAHSLTDRNDIQRSPIGISRNMPRCHSGGTVVRSPYISRSNVQTAGVMPIRSRLSEQDIVLPKETMSRGARHPRGKERSRVERNSRTGRGHRRLFCLYSCASEPWTLEPSLWRERLSCEIVFLEKRVQAGT